MKIKVKKTKAPMSFEDVYKIPKYEHKKPRRPSRFFGFLMKTLGKSDLKETDFKAVYKGIDRIPDEPCLILMNHSSFIDLEIAANVLYPAPYSIVCTSDGFVGKEGLMRSLGCIPTNKFVSDATLISDISYALHKNRNHVLMYPEASYSFDGRATELPRKLGVVLKLLKVPVVMITTYGAFARDPLYNMLQKRQVKVSAEISLLFSTEDIKTRSVAELDAALDAAFSFDNFAWQKENGIRITESFRADGLERILYKCPVCMSEGRMTGKGIKIGCSSCGASYELGELGDLIPIDESPAVYDHIPDWYAWERRMVAEDIKSGKYLMEFDADILVLRDMKAMYDIGRGHLKHDNEGFVLTGADGTEYLRRSPEMNYSLYADYYWYELGDIICIGTNDMLFYCFPDKDARIPVAKARLATEELYKFVKANKRSRRINDAPATD